MTFQVGDWVLWWGEIGQVIGLTVQDEIIFQHRDRDIDCFIISNERAKEHQRPWQKVGHVLIRC